MRRQKVNRGGRHDSDPRAASTLALLRARRGDVARRGWHGACSTGGRHAGPGADGACTDGIAPMATAPIDRAKILADLGVFGDFSVYKLRPDYGMLPAADRKAAAGEVLAVVAKHKDKVIVDAYLTRGFDAKSDYFLRVHAMIWPPPRPS